MSSQKNHGYDFDILFEDTHLIVVNKHAGLLSQGDASGADNLVDQLRDYFGRHYVGLLHRLDRNTSGIMIVAKRTKSAQRLSAAMKSGKVDRSYLAVVKGEVTQQQRYSDFLRKSSHNKVFCESTKTHPESKEAILEITPLSVSSASLTPLNHAIDKATLAWIRLETGRPHQIRVQCQHHGHPVVGDSKYDNSASSKLFHRPALHSYILSFDHPKTAETMQFKAPLPGDIINLIDRLKVSDDLSCKLEGLHHDG